MVTHLLRLALAHSLKPFLFQASSPEDEENRSPDIFLSNSFGLYIHVPFCEKICDFCPYNKEIYSAEKMKMYIAALKREISLKAGRVELQANAKLESIYLGGGSPALAAEYLPDIFNLLEEYFGETERIGVELHPRDVSPENLLKLKELGVNMVSLGVQSFDQNSLEQINRDGINVNECFTLIKDAGFEVVDVDLIFALPGQTEKMLERDFKLAVKSGGSQISTYPFIRFSFAGKKYPRPSRRRQRSLLKLLVDVAGDMGYERTSVWTFAEKGSERYSSVTRDNVLGFGPSATSLFSGRFTINTFSVDEYCRSLENTQSPVALELFFKPRVRKMYWLFWSCYNIHISGQQYRTLFKEELDHEFGGVLRAALFLKLIEKTDEGYNLTEKGAVLFHRVEQVYTHQYIDKTWRICRSNPRPARIGLF